MPQARKSPSKKSDWRDEAIKTHFNKCIFTSNPFPGQRVNKVYLDFLQWIHSLNPEATAYAGNSSFSSSSQKGHLNSFRNEFSYLNGNESNESPVIKDITRIGVKTFREVIMDLKRVIEKEAETADEVFVMLDKNGPAKVMPLAKSPTERKRRQGEPGRGSFKDFCKHISPILGNLESLVFVLRDPSTTTTTTITTTAAGAVTSGSNTLNQGPGKNLPNVIIVSSEEFHLKVLHNTEELFVVVADNKNELQELSVNAHTLTTFLKNRENEMKATTGDESVLHVLSSYTLKQGEFAITSVSMPPIEECLKLDKLVPKNFYRYLKIKDARTKLIRFVCEQLLSPDSPVRLKFPYSSKVILDGADLDLKTLEKLGVTNHLDNKTLTPAQIAYTPISTFYSPVNRMRIVQLEPQYYNELGEADDLAAFYAMPTSTDSNLNKKMIMKFDTTDTDFIIRLLMVLYLAKTVHNTLPEHMGIREFLIFRRLHGPRQSGAKRFSTGKKKEKQPEQQSTEKTEATSTTADSAAPRQIEEWISVNKLYDLIVKDPALNHFDDNAILMVVLNFLMAGCDFTDPYSYVTPKTFFDSLIKYGPRILSCPVVIRNPATCELTISLDNFEKMLALAYATKFVKKTDQEIFAMTPDDVRDYVSSSQKNNQLWFPSRKDNEYSLAQVLYCFEMMRHLGAPSYPKLDLRKYGYRCMDPEDEKAKVPLTYENIERASDDYAQVSTDKISSPRKTSSSKKQSTPVAPLTPKKTQSNTTVVLESPPPAKKARLHAVSATSSVVPAPLQRFPPISSFDKHVATKNVDVIDLDDN